MKIDINSCKKVTFASIKIGDCFTYNKELYIRIESFPGDSSARAVNLRTGLIAFFPSSDGIEPVNCKVVEDK